MVCTLINDTRHHSGQNTVDSQGAKKMLFFRVRAEKGLCSHIDVGSIVQSGCEISSNSNKK